MNALLRNKLLSSSFCRKDDESARNHFNAYEYFYERARLYA